MEKVMTPDKRQRLEAKGWTFGTVDEFLGNNMITPEQFKNVDEFILAVNKLKLDKYACSVLAYDQWIDHEEDSANEFIRLWRDRPGVYVGGVE
jgi:hypothetical protein